MNRTLLEFFTDVKKVQHTNMFSLTKSCCLSPKHLILPAHFDNAVYNDLVLRLCFEYKKSVASTLKEKNIFYFYFN